jgi:hypothetical protein
VGRYDRGVVHPLAASTLLLLAFRLVITGGLLALVATLLRRR